jgi:Zn-dependent M16 (insulinase) family peptidase
MKTLEIAAEMQEGDTLHGYTINSVTDVPEFDLVAVQLTHNRTGAKHLHLARDDDNNSFGVAFRTVPRDSSGVAHILEHTVLCGSRKYPVRDPFFKMMNRSMATFMNAFTANDWTFYPFSTRNKKDYYNLMSVYMDSVFNPILRQLDFRQEGWRLEHENPWDQHSSIIFKGVVFNEMKGYFASPENVYSQVAQNLLYPTTTYSKVSGGHPISILELTCDQLKAFHAEHYHPSNARFFTYGNFSLCGHLKHLNQDYLQYYVKSAVNTEIPYEPRWLEPREYCTVGPKENNTAQTAGRYFVGISFLLFPVNDAYHSLLLSVLSKLLLDGPSSPLYQTLIESNIGSEYTPNTGYDASTNESSFSVGLQGVKREGIELVKDAVWDALSKVSRKGFEEERVESVLHQIELQLKHQTSHYGRSLMMVMDVCVSWYCGIDVWRTL